MSDSVGGRIPFPPTTKFKVWAVIEAADDVLDSYGDVAIPVCLGSFDALEEAEAALENIAKSNAVGP